MIYAIECDTTEEIICTPESVNELFELPFVDIGFFSVNRTMILMLLAAIIVVALLFFAFRRPKVIPGKFQASMEAVVRFVDEDIAKGIIGPVEGAKYTPYLLSLFLFILVGNLFEIMPFINFPITSRIALPLFLALLTWVIFVFVGFKKNGFRYLRDIVWPPGVPVIMKPLVGIIEFFSIFFIRPFSLAVRLFANLTAGHVMLSLLLVTGVLFFGDIAEINFKVVVGGLWFLLGLGIFVFEIIVSILQAYIFTLLSAVYIQTSVHPEH